MRYRELDKNGDMTFGNGSNDYLTDIPAAPAQAIKTRLLLITGEWFLDVTEGTPYKTKILGKGTMKTYDPALRDRILGTEGVLSLDSYESIVNDRALTVKALVTTIYGKVAISAVF